MHNRSLSMLVGKCSDFYGSKSTYKNSDSVGDPTAHPAR